MDDKNPASAKVGWYVPRKWRSWCLLTWLASRYYPKASLRWYVNININIGIFIGISLLCAFIHKLLCAPQVCTSSLLCRSACGRHCLDKIQRGKATFPSQMGMQASALLWDVWSTSSNPTQTEYLDLLPLEELFKLLDLHIKKLPPMPHKLIEKHKDSEHDHKIRL